MKGYSFQLKTPIDICVCVRRGTCVWGVVGVHVYVQVPMRAHVEARGL